MSSELRRQLGSLHAQLAGLSAVDAETKQLLLVVLADISRLLGPESTADNSPVERLETLAARFDADHPALSTALRQLLDALAKAGI